MTYTALLSLVSLSTACSTIKAQDSESVATPSPTDTSFVSQVVALGKLIPQGDVIKISVANAQDSRVNQILVNEGDFVKANQVIAILQGRDRTEQQLRDAQANVAVKRAQLLKIKQGDYKEGEIVAQRAVIDELEARIYSETKQRKAALAEAKATLINAQLRYHRDLTLNTEGAISQSALDDALLALNKAQAIMQQSQAELENTKTTLQAQLAKEQANLKRLQEVRPVDVEIAKAELEQAQIQVEQRKAELDDTLVRVPISGQILRINTRVGELVSTQQGIAELGRTNQMHAIAEVYETDIAQVRIGQQTTMTSEYGGFQGELRGQVTKIGLQIGKTHLNQNQNNPTNDVNARVVEVEIRLNPQDSPKVAALTGMQVRVKISTSN
ncbi:HlyD family efflux transporter periplasmic adaptor subunit [Scytonema sp. UIC 10036]|uniref:HlyD family efflux transporter periplasmic adaptor subunit n=1 Tax=Scytonema sp. UIC 10036 TaxID=2304196 RepID=UPI001FA9D64C|nr:HlyD family efflux transporter periplasmic adaptor subunit [Scytonema sp. UIC 10036]